MAADLDGSNRPTNLASVIRQPVVEPDPKFDVEPDKKSMVVYEDEILCVTKNVTPDLKSITINIGGAPPGVAGGQNPEGQQQRPPPGVVGEQKPQRQQKNVGKQNVVQHQMQAPPLWGTEQRQPPRQPAKQGAAQSQRLELPTSPPQSTEVVIPVDSELPLCDIPQPEGPPPELTEWPTNSQANDTCEIRDIDAAANLKTKYGENPCKLPPATKKDNASSKPAAADISNKEAGSSKSSDSKSPSHDGARSSKPLVNTDLSDDGCSPSQKPIQPMGRSVADSDISNYGTPGYSGNYTPKKPRYSGGDHDIGGRFQTPAPYNPGAPPQHPWPEDNRRISSSGHYTYPPTPPPTPPPPRGYAPRSQPPPPPQHLPPCPPEEDVYYDAQDDFYYDTQSQVDWCPPGYYPASRPCNFGHSRFAEGIPRPLHESNARHTGRRITHICNAESQSLEDGKVQSSENEGCKPRLLLGKDIEQTVIIKHRKGHHKEGCPWQRKGHYQIQPGDVRNTSFNQKGLEVPNSDDLKVVKRESDRILHMDEQGQLHYSAHWQRLQSVVDHKDGGDCGEMEHRWSGELEPSSNYTHSMLCDGSELVTPYHSSLPCNITLEEDFEPIHDHKDDGTCTENGECTEEYTDEVEPSLENPHPTPCQVVELMPVTSDQLDDKALKPNIELEEKVFVSDSVFEESHQANSETARSCPMYSLNLQRRRSNPAFPLILRLGSWVKDVLLPDYPK